MVSYDDLQTLIIILIFGILGIVVSMITKRLYDLGIVVDEFCTGSVTILDLQTGIIILFLMIGVIIAAVKK